MLAPLLLTAALATAPCPPCDAERITWTPDVELTVADFRGPLGGDRNAAEANTGIKTSSRAGAHADSFVVEATTFFDPCASWFRQGRGWATDSATLAHERIHFDLTEVYARRLMRRYAEDVGSHAEFLGRHERLYEQTWAELQAAHRRFDTEVYADEALTPQWRARVSKLLDEVSAYAEKRVTLPMR